MAPENPQTMPSPSPGVQPKIRIVATPDIPSARATRVRFPSRSEKNNTAPMATNRG